MQKLKGQSGETIIETLVSMLIAVICISMLATSMLAAARINEKVRRKLTAELSFRYSNRRCSRPKLCSLPLQMLRQSPSRWISRCTRAKMTITGTGRRGGERHEQANGSKGNVSG